MKTHRRFACLIPRPNHVLLLLVIATSPAENLFAQGYGAQQAVRRSVEGLGTPADESEPVPFEQPPGPEQYAPPPDASSAGVLDITYVAPTASAVVVLRPAQILTSPNAELLPTEVVKAAGLQYLGVDLATVDEVVAFFDVSNPIGPTYGATIKFNQPFRGSSLPPHVRPSVQLAELAGRKYLQSAHPVWPSFYGTNSRTLIAAPEATMRPLVESSDQPKAGPLIDRIRDVSAGHDLYVAVDVASLRPLVQMAQGAMPAGIPPEAQAALEAPNLIAAAELTLNISAPGPTSLVLHANDEAAAQQLEAMLAGAANEQVASPDAEFAANDPIAQALASYRQRMKQQFRQHRDGASLTCFHIDGNSPAQQQVASFIVVSLSLLGPALEEAQAAQQAQSMPAMEPLPAEEPAP